MTSTHLLFTYLSKNILYLNIYKMLTKVDDTFQKLNKYLVSHAINNPRYDFPLHTYDNSKKYLVNKKIFICGGCELSYVYDYLNFISETFLMQYYLKTYK